MIFGIGSAFSEGPGPGPGSLYKVCLLEVLYEVTGWTVTFLLIVLYK